MFTASTTCGTRTIVVISPMCPPASVPSAITASAPHLSIILAMATEATTGITFIPAFFHISIYFPGFPAPVVTTFTLCFATTFAISSACGFISIIFTPKGLSVNVFALIIWSSTHLASAPPAPIIPSPPALDTAAARLASATQAMPPWIIGYSISKISVKAVFIIASFCFLIF